MARVTLTFEDLPNGKVKVEMTPNAKTIAMKELGGHEGGMTSAEAMALFCARKVREESKANDLKVRLQLPDGFRRPS